MFRLSCLSHLHSPDICNLERYIQTHRGMKMYVICCYPSRLSERHNKWNITNGKPLVQWSMFSCCFWNISFIMSYLQRQTFKDAAIVNSLQNRAVQPRHSEPKCTCNKCRRKCRRPSDVPAPISVQTIYFLGLKSLVVCDSGGLKKTR